MIGIKSLSKVILYVYLLIGVQFIKAASSKCDKWIVITTINKPNEATKKLASLPGWKIVIVGDKKTPSDWENHPEYIYLSPEKQTSLGFKIAEFIPWNHYCRKNIGYLYAIKNGASVIYETDDDTFLYDNHYLDNPSIINTIDVITKKAYFNIFTCFGHSTVWPRGFPLSKITESNPYTLIGPQDSFCPIQSSLVNGDPDVDAIFRLTIKKDITFSKDSIPMSLTKGTMCPFNTQNTVVHKEAFWALLIPLSCAYRATDIWRGYWNQRLLWDIGAKLCFTSPIAYQIRNEHNLLLDFEQEISMYLDSEKLIDFLVNWKSNSATLEDRMIELISRMLENKFFNSNIDVKLMKAWIEDLKSIQYKFPTIIS